MRPNDVYLSQMKAIHVRAGHDYQAEKEGLWKMTPHGKDYEATDTSEMSVEEWLEARKPYIGGSDAACVAGVNPWRSPFAVAVDKLGKATTEVNEAMYWGNRLERMIAEDAIALLSGAYDSTDELTESLPGASLHYSPKEMYVSTKYPWAACNVDGIIEHNAARYLLECKNSSGMRLSQWMDGVPTEFQAQVQHSMAVRSDLVGAYVAALVGGNRFVIHYVPRDEDAIASLMKVEQQFFKEVMTDGRLPEPSGTDGDRTLLLQMYDQVEEKKVVDLGTQAERLAKDLKQATADKKEADTRHKACQNQLRALMRDAQQARAGMYKVSRIQYERKAYEVKAGVVDKLDVREVKNG